MLHSTLSAVPYGPHARTVHLILESSDPVGPSLRRLGNSDCIVMTFPRDAFRRVVTWPELDRSGIYILVAPAIGEFALRAYVGEARNLLKRLDGHERDRIDQRYIQIVAITSADDQLREDVTGYIEQRLIWTLNETKLVEVDNRSPTYPPLPADVRIRAERFFQDALLLLGPVEPMMGLVAATIAGQERRRQFTRDNGPRPVAPIDGDKLYELKRDRCHAFAIKSPTSGMRVLAGARVATEVHYTLPRRGVALRQRLIADGSLVHSPEAGTFILTRDIEVFSPAGAANLVTGRRMDGYHSWMPIKDGKEAGEV
jgi:hypothetical protein